MTFDELLRAVSAGNFSGIAIDSRTVAPGDLYVALRGERSDGHDFVGQALERGALAVVVERAIAATTGLESRAVVVEDTRRALSPLAAAFHRDPSRGFDAIGVTGTNGKTTTTQMIAAIFEAAGRPCGTIGTIGARFGDREWPLANTTPQPPELQGLLAQMRDAGAQAVAMEVSSHALALERVEDVRFAVGAFTNLTRDHLDFHKTADAYAAAKRHLFDLAERCVYNAEDPYGMAWARETRDAKPTITYALSGEADVRPRDVAIRPSGSTFAVDGVRFTVHLPGRFNVSNALCAIACARALGIDDATSARGLENVRRVPGRMEPVLGGDIAVIVDYAHTPDSLENALTALREASTGALGVVFGCGGDRDRGKRPLMGAIAARLADRIYVTDDNPRTEDPTAIRAEIVAGVGEAEHEEVADRRAAILRAIAEAQAGDTVLIAGKGHENYQIVGTEVLPFDDVATAREALATPERAMIPFELAVRATNAEVSDADRAPATLRVATDTRSIEPGDAFLALRGDKFDGHAYTAEAVARGAAALIVDERSAAVEGVTTLIVPSTLHAYLALARVARDRFGGRVVAITGSAGKTTTKELLAQLLRAHYGDRIAASPANENNEIGVSKFLLANADAKRDVLVVEMGARHYDDIAPLVIAARPDLGILTNVGEAHVEIMGSRERLAHTKWGLFSGGARAVLNARDEVSLARAPSLQEAPHWFAATEDERISTGGKTTLLVGATRLIVIDGDRDVERGVEVRLPGAHNRANLAAAIAGALELGVPLETIVATVPHVTLPKGRYEAIDLPGRPRLIYDAYNANLSGMLAALDAFADEAGERRIAVLASMAELGPEAPAMHEQVGERAAGAVDVVLVGGKYADELARGAAAGGLSSERIVRFASNDEAARWIDASARPGDVVLLKGSRVYALEEIVERLRA